MHVCVQPALDALLSGEFHETTSSIFYSDNEDDGSEPVEPIRVFVPATSMPKKQAAHGDDLKMK